jgi:hypothetical protein
MWVGPPREGFGGGFSGFGLDSFSGNETPESPWWLLIHVKAPYKALKMNQAFV